MSVALAKILEPESGEISTQQGVFLHHALLGDFLMRSTGIPTHTLASYRQLPMWAQGMLAAVPMLAVIAA
jgi:hypothetical protein